MPLTSQQIRFLKGKGHALKPVLHIGKDGLTEGFIASCSKSLDDHELIKIALLETAELDRKEVARDLAAIVAAEVVQVLGRKILLYRRNSERQKIVFVTPPPVPPTP